VCSQNINKQILNIADETLTDYSFLSRYNNTKSKNYLKRRYRIRHWIPMFIWTPCMCTVRTPLPLGVEVSWDKFISVSMAQGLVSSLCISCTGWSALYVFHVHCTGAGVHWQVPAAVALVKQGLQKVHFIHFKSGNSIQENLENDDFFKWRNFYNENNSLVWKTLPLKKNLKHAKNR